MSRANCVFTVISMPQRILSRREAAVYVGGNDNLQRLLHAEWLKPISGKGRVLDFDIRAIDTALDRVSIEGEWPADESRLHSERSKPLD